MANVRIEIKRAAIRDILRSAKVRDDLDRRARAIAAAAGPGHEVETVVGPNRARASVRTATFAAARREARDHTLTRALDAGR